MLIAPELHWIEHYSFPQLEANILSNIKAVEASNLVLPYKKDNILYRLAGISLGYLPNSFVQDKRSHFMAFYWCYFFMSCFVCAV